MSVCLRRFGVKGTKAAEWLAAQGLTVPQYSNTCTQTGHTLLLRLGSTEFLVEDELSGEACAMLAKDYQDNILDVYKVLRADAAFIISGHRTVSLCAELCQLDLGTHAF